MTIERQFGRGVAWMAFGNWIEQATNFIVFFLLARLLGAEAFGLLAMAAAFVLFGEFLVRNSISDFLIAHEDPGTGHFNAAFWVLTAIGVAICVVLATLAGPIAAFYGDERVRPLIWALSLTVPVIAVTAVPVAILSRELKFRILSLRAIAGVLAGGVVGVSMALTGFGVWSLVGQRLVQVLVNVVMAWGAVTWRPGRSFSADQRRDLWHFGRAVLALRGAELAATQVPTVIIGVMLGPVAVGYFALAWRIVEIGSFVISLPLRLVAQPAFAAMARSGEGATRLLRQVSMIAGLAAFPAFVGLSVLARPVLALMFGGQWLPAAPILSVLCFFGIYLCIEKLNQAFCLAAGRPVATAQLAWLEVATAVALVLAVSPWGAVAMVGGFVLSFALIWPLRLRVVGGVATLGGAELAGLQVAPLAGSALMAGLVWAALALAGPVGYPTALGLGVVTGAIAYGAYSLAVMRPRLRLAVSFLTAPKTTGDTP